MALNTSKLCFLLGVLIAMAANKENICPSLPTTSTPCKKTPVKLLPPLPQTPVGPSHALRLEASAGKVCFICCKASLPKQLRSISSNIAVPEASSVLILLKKCFSVELTLERLEFHKMKVCLPCKNMLEKVSVFKEKVDCMVETFQKTGLDDSLGCSALLSTPDTKSKPRAKRLLPTDSTPQAQKRERKKACNSESQRSLSFASEHSYSLNTTSSQEASSLSLNSLEIYQTFMTEQILDEDERQKLQSVLVEPCVTENEIAMAVYRSSCMPSLESLMIREMSTKMVQLCSTTLKPGPSVLRSSGNAKDLQRKDVLSDAVVELKRELPFLCHLLTGLSVPPSIAAERSDIYRTIGTIYGMIMYSRNKNINAVQKLNTAAAVRLHADNELIEILHRCGIALASSYKLEFLDQLGKFNTDGIVESIRRNKKGKLTMDNIDGMLRAKHIRIDKKNAHFHYAASTYYTDRCNPHELAHLSMARPPIPEVVDCGKFFLTEEEAAMLKTNYGLQLGRLLVRFCPELQWMDKVIPKHIPHQYSEVMARKSEIFPLQVILEDPKYYQGCMVILQELVALLRSCYEEAGQLEEFERMIVPLGGDQLVRVRTTGARDLYAGAGDRKGIFPEIIEFFHVQQDFLEKMFKALYKPKAQRDLCSLPFLKVELDRTNVNGQVKGRYQAHQDFAHTAGSSILLQFAMDKLGMQNPEDPPGVPGLPENIARTHLPGRKQYFEQLMSGIIDEIYQPFTPPHPDQYVPVNIHIPGRGDVPVNLNYDHLQREQAVNVGVPLEGGGIHIVRVQLNENGQDDVKSYSTQLLQWYIHMLEFEDAIKEGDIFRCNVCLKLMIPFFYGHSPRSKYAVECIDYILKTETLLPAALAIRCRLGSFVNPHGGNGKNKPSDMQQENNILVLKDVIKGLGAGKTGPAIVRASKSAPVANDIVENYKKILGMHTRKGLHEKKSDDQDVRLLLNRIKAIDPFRFTPGRVMTKYRGIKSSAFDRIDKQKFVKHLSEITNRLKRGLNVDLDYYTE